MTTLLAAHAVPGAEPEPDVIRGVLQAEREVRIGSPIDAVLYAVPVKEGDRVEADAVLARLDDRVQAARVETARLAANFSAEFKRAEIAIGESRNTVHRVENALARDAASDWELKSAAAQLAQLQAELEALRQRQRTEAQRLALEQEILRQFTLRAPFAGTVTRIDVQAGAYLARGTAIMTLVALERMKITAFVTAAPAARLQLGRTYTFALDDAAGEVAATLSYIEPVMEPGSRTLRCVFEFDNRNQAHAAGLGAELRLGATAQGEGSR